MADIPLDRERIADFCRSNKIRKLALFGSALRDDFGPDSDVDVLVEFDSDHVPGFLRLFEMEEELSQMFDGRRIDIVTKKFLNPRICDRVLAEAEVEYAEG